MKYTRTANDKLGYTILALKIKNKICDFDKVQITF